MPQKSKINSKVIIFWMIGFLVPIIFSISCGISLHWVFMGCALSGPGAAIILIIDPAILAILSLGLWLIFPFLMKVTIKILCAAFIWVVVGSLFLNAILNKALIT